MSIFICQWDADKFADRNKNLVKRAGQHLLKRFSYQGREFLLLSFPMSNYSAVRCAELLGGRLASLDSPELLALAQKELKAFKNHSIRIGAYAKRDKWYWMSGRELTEQVHYSAKISRYKTETRNNNLAILHDGKIYDSASASAFLLELASPNLR